MKFVDIFEMASSQEQSIGYNALILIDATLAKEEQFKQLTEFADILEKRAHDVEKYQEYEIEQEGDFKDKIEHANSITLWCAIVQGIVFIALGSWQILSLRKYFVKRGIA